MATIKPDLTRVWANGAPSGNVVDPDTTTPGKVNSGWQAEVPPFEHFNFLQKWFTQGLAHFNEQGIAIWDTNTTYPIDGFSKGSDGQLYVAITEQNGNDPVSDTGSNWIKYSLLLQKLGLLVFNSIDDMQANNNSLGVVISSGDKMISGSTLFKATSSPSYITLPNGLFAEPLNNITADDFGGTGNSEVNEAVNASKGSQKVIISGEPTYNQEVLWKGKEHETAGLPFQLNSEPISGGALNARMTVSNGYLYLCSYGSNSIKAFSLTDPREPVMSNEWTVSSQPRHIDIIGRHALVCCHGAAKIEIYDLSNPSSPGLVGEIPTGSNPKMFELSGNEIYVVCAGSNTLEKYTFQLPSEGISFNYIKIASVGVSGTPLCCSFNGEGLVAVCGLDTNSVDLIGSSTLNLISSKAIGGPGHGTCVWFNKTQLLVTDSTNSQLHSVNYENISIPSYVSISVVPNPEQIEIIGNRCYIPWLSGTGTPSKLSAIDLTDVKSPVEYKQVDLTVNGGGFTTYYQNGNNGYLYVNGHFSPYNIEVIEVVTGEDDNRPTNVYETLFARTAGISKLDVGLNNVFQRYNTALSGRAATIDDNIIRSGNSAAISLPDPSDMPGKQLTIINVNASGTSDVTNAFVGFSGTLASFASVTVVSMDFSGGFQWDAISSHGTIT